MIQQDLYKIIECKVLDICENANIISIKTEGNLVTVIYAQDLK